VKGAGGIGDPHVDDRVFDFASVAVVLSLHARRLRAALGDSRFVNQTDGVVGGVLFGDDALAIVHEKSFVPLDAFQEPL
jgi:hypothetical protein